MWKINFKNMEIVDKIVKTNVFLKSEEIDAQINAEVGQTILSQMAEFDGGHDKDMCEDAMWKIAEHKACLEPVLSQITFEEEMELIIAHCQREL